MIQRLFLIVISLLLTVGLSAQCEVLPTLQQDSTLVLSPASGSLDAENFWVTNPAILTSLTWTGQSLGEQVDTSSLASDEGSIARYEFFVPSVLASEVPPDTFLLAIRAEPVVQDSIVDLWLAFSSGFDVFASFPDSPLQSLQNSSQDSVWLGVVSPEDGWTLKYKSLDGRLGDILIVPKNEGRAFLHIHGSQPGYRMTEILLGPPTVKTSSAFITGNSLPISQGQPVSQEQISFEVEGQIFVPDTLFLCINDTVTLSAPASISEDTQSQWEEDGVLVGENVNQLGIGPFSSGDTVTYTADFEGEGICAVANLTVVIQEASASLAQILSPEDEAIICDSEVLLTASSPGPGLTGAWTELGENPVLEIAIETDTTARITNPLPGSYEIEWTVSEGNCSSADTLEVFFIDSVPLDLGGDTTICLGDTLILGAESIEGFEYQWFPTDFVATPDSNFTQVFPAATTVFLLVGTDPEASCTTSDEITVEVIPNAQITGIALLAGAIEQSLACTPIPTVTLNAGSAMELEFLTDTGDPVSWQVSANEGNVILSNPTESGSGKIIQTLSLPSGRLQGSVSFTGTIGSAECGTPDSCRIVIQVVGEVIPGELQVPKAITANGDGLNDTWAFLNMASNGTYRVWVFNQGGGLVFESENYQNTNNWDGGPLPDGTYWFRVEEEVGGQTQTYTGGLLLQRNPR